eukprot:2814715-Prymnesium_polylepis.1
MDRPTDALRESVCARHVDRCRMSFVWVPSVSVALVGPHASMLDDVWLSDRVFCICGLSKLAAAYRGRTVVAHAAGTSLSCRSRSACAVMILN